MGNVNASVIVLNFNGVNYLDDCLSALGNQTYPHTSFEVILSDNGSSDDSRDFVRVHFPWVRVLENKKNLGFAAGNNAAMRIAAGELIVLLNNDTIPERTWLENLIKAAQQDPDVGMVTSNLRLFYNQLQVSLEVESDSTNDEREEGTILLYKVESPVEKGIIQYISGFHSYEIDSLGRYYRRIDKVGVLGLPVPPGNTDWNINLTIATHPKTQFSGRLRISINDKVIKIISGLEHKPRNYSIALPSVYRSFSSPLVQNSGSIIFRDGRGRDRGTYVQQTEIFYEEDHGQYSSGEVFSGCGAGLLLKKKMLDDVGLFDEQFFMYYEDTDLSWRSRLKNWKVYFEREAIVRHVHCGTMVEWSNDFLFMTDHNRLIMVFKNDRMNQVLQTWGRYFFKFLVKVLYLLWMKINKAPYYSDLSLKTHIQARVILSLIKDLPSLWSKRRLIQRSKRISYNDIEYWFVVN